MSRKNLNDEDYPTTGHEWDGIREYDKPMPRWWVITFYLTILWGVGYLIAYPAWPLINGATPGLLGYASRTEVALDIAKVKAANAALDRKLVEVSLDQIETDAALNHYAVSGGAAVFRTNCLQCHGAGAQGSVGYPNLLDDDWLWGGDINAIYQTISHGIRVNTDDDTRYSEMPKFGEFLEESEIAQAVQYVRKLSGATHNEGLVVAGAEIFADNCASCHADNGTGDRDQGAPDLTDAIWLFGGDADSLTATVTNSRFGVMPNWNNRLTEAQIRQVTAYVHQLGGGEN